MKEWPESLKELALKQAHVSRAYSMWKSGVSLDEVLPMLVISLAASLDEYQTKELARLQREVDPVVIPRGGSSD